MNPLEGCKSDEEKGAARAAPSFFKERVKAIARALDRGGASITDARLRIVSYPREKLEVLYRRAFRDASAKPATFLLLGERYTAIGVPPALRPLPEGFEVIAGHEELRHLLVLADLQWLRHHYRRHVATHNSWQRLFREDQPGYFLANHISHHGQRSSSQMLRGLSLSEHQQRDCLVVRHGGGTWLPPFLRLCGECSAALGAEQRRREGRAMVSGKLRQRGDYLRRYEVWRCAQIAGGRPARAAALYAANTGRSISRQLAAKLAAEAERDLRAHRRRLRECNV